MKNDTKKFVNEITDNFSELFVETFFIRYLKDFQIDGLIENIIISQDMLTEKINKYFLKKLKQMGYSKDILKKLQ